MQTYDSTFSKDATEKITLHWDGLPTTHGGPPGVDLFDDNIQYWNPATPGLGVQNPHTGTQIWIQGISTQGNFLQVQVRPSQ